MQNAEIKTFAYRKTTKYDKLKKRWKLQNGFAAPPYFQWNGGFRMFEIGEYVVYGNHGVCKVENIGKLDMKGENRDKLYYWLTPVCGQGSKIYSPVDNPKTLMRNVLTKDAAEKLIDEVDEIETLWIKDEKQREAAYKKAIYSADCRCLLQIIKTIYLRKEERVKSGKKITATDERYFKLAEDRLYQELCVPLGLEDNYESIQMSKKNEFVALFMKNCRKFLDKCYYSVYN